MENMRHKFIYLLPTLCVAALVESACLPEPEPAIDQASVLSDNTSVRIDSASSARTLFTLDEGDRVDIIQRQGSWYLVRDIDRIEGWMDAGTLIRDTTRQTMEIAVIEARAFPIQNTGVTTDAVNLRIAPGRDSDIIRRLRRGRRLEILDRETTPRPNSDLTDIWFQVRPTENEVGWVFSQLMEFDTPEVLLPFREGRTLSLGSLTQDRRGSEYWLCKLVCRC